MTREERLALLRQLRIAGFPKSDYLEWIDKVAPLLKYDQRLYDNFQENAQHVRAPRSDFGHVFQLSEMFSIVKQAIAELETHSDSEPVPKPTEAPSNKVEKETKKVFISHTAHEAKLAICLKDSIESTFSGHVKVFVSSDQRDLRAGHKWFDEVDAALNAAGVLLVLCSPYSVTRPWIHFESGCAWIRRVPVIPVCHSGLLKGALAPPLSSFQALTLEEGAFSEQLLTALAHHVGISELPAISYTKMDGDLRKAAGEIVTPSSPAPTSPTPRSRDDDYISILRDMAVLNRSVGAKELAERLRMNPAKIEYLLRSLEENEYIHGSYVGGYYLAHKGSQYLVENNLL